jgi:N utilization substance protein A
MANALSQTIEQISREKGIEPQLIREALEDAMAAAAGRFLKTEEDLHGRFDPETGLIEVFAVKKIVETVEDDTTEMSLAEALDVDETFQVGEYIELPKPTLELGRIAAQTAKQVITQKVREAEREIVFEEFSSQVGQIVNGLVRRLEGRDLILDIGRTEAILPLPEQSRDEMYKPGDRVRAVIIKVHRLSKGPQLVVSRADPSLLVRLFESEIPEVYDGTVVIKNVVREGGERAKVAVSSTDNMVDPVGACVGMKGSRINAVIRDLRGEKIDIIQYSDDIVEYTNNALNPAKISKVLIADPVAQILEVVVPEDQLSLAIGKKGQNVRLASKLLGWEINIKSEADKKLEILLQMEKLSGLETGLLIKEIDGIGEKTKERLLEVGVRTAEKLLAASIEELQEIPGLGLKMVEKLRAVVEKAYLSQEAVESTGSGASVAEELSADLPGEIGEAPTKQEVD